MQDNGLALIQQIVQPLKDNFKKEKDFWGDDETNDEESAAEDLEFYEEYTEAIKRHKKQIKTHPKDAQTYLDLVEAIDYKEIYNPQTDESSQQASYRHKVEWLSTALKHLPDSKALYRERAEIHFFNENYQKALHDYTEILKLDPQDTDALRSRGATYKRMDQLQKAQLDYDAYIKIQPQTAEQYYFRGIFHYTRGRFEQAEQDLSRSIGLDSNKESAHFFRAEIYFAQNRYDDSIADYKKSLKLDFGQAGFSLGRIGMNYYYQGNYKMAEEALAACLKIAPQLDTVIAWYLSRQKQEKTSKAALEHIASHFNDENLEGAVIHLFLDKISPEDVLKKKTGSTIITGDYSASSAAYYVGQYYLMRGETAKAKTMFEQSIQESEEPYFPGKLFSEKELARLKSVKDTGADQPN